MPAQAPTLAERSQKEPPPTEIDTGACSDLHHGADIDRAGAAASAAGGLHLVGKAFGSDPGDSGARRATANQPPTGQTDEPVSERTSRQVRPRTPEDIANEQTAEQLAMRSPLSRPHSPSPAGA
jgi:hypothetical protein